MFSMSSVTTDDRGGLVDDFDRQQRVSHEDPSTNSNEAPGENEPAATQSHSQKFTVYKWRWYILFVLCLFNTSNAAIWLTFSPIADVTAAFYNIDGSQVNWLSLVFLIISIPVGLTASWVIDTFGLRLGILLGASLNGLGAIVRAASAFGVAQNVRYPVALVGQCLSAASQPFAMFTPTKLAATWFPDSQRATANMLASMANPLGLLLSNVISPLLAPTLEDSKDEQQSHFTVMMIVYAVPCLIAMLMAVFGVCSSTPPSPPSASAAEESEPFFVGLKMLFKSRAFVVLAVSFGTGLGLLTTVSTLLEQMLCGKGYSDTFAGICGALMVGFGLLGAGVASVYVDKTKQFEEVVKLGFSFSAMSAIGFMISTRYHDAEIPIAISCSLIGLFGFSLYAICMELGVECTYPVAEATSAGMQIIFGQGLGVVFILAFQAMTQPLSPFDVSRQTCKSDGPVGVKPVNYTASLYLFAGLLVGVQLLLMATFRTPYKRVEAEKRMRLAAANNPAAAPPFDYSSVNV